LNGIGLSFSAGHFCLPLGFEVPPASAAGQVVKNSGHRDRIRAQLVGLLNEVQGQGKVRLFGLVLRFLNQSSSGIVVGMPTRMIGRIQVEEPSKISEPMFQIGEIGGAQRGRSDQPAHLGIDESGVE
jgi:hypothetical protein